jgi:acetoacetyl-CoA synthetase
MQANHIVFRPSPEVIADSQLTAFIRYCEQQTGLSIRDSTSLHKYAVREFREFWRCFLSWSRIDFEGSIHPVCTDDRCEAATFFPDLRLSYVENLLRITSEKYGDRTALTCCRASGVVEKFSRYTLRVRVTTLAAKLHRLGVQPGDRVAAVAHNSSEAVIGALAAAAVGATFSSASPEMGAPAILSRFQQLSPKILMAHMVPAGQVERSALSYRIAEVARGLPSLDALIMLDEGPLSTDVGVASWRLSDILANRDEMSGDTLAWPRFPFNHPLFILFSSGTTGRPKCIVHGAGGTLLEHIKEHRLHGDMRSTDKLFFYTSTAWMMWNWQLSALACGTEIVLFDGPVTDPETLWRLVSEHGVTVFGASPSFLKLCEDAGYSPRRKLSLPVLRAILSTGSVLHDHQYDWVQENVGSVPLQSISGGTDIIGCFVLGNPNLPVYRGESQCRSLGLDVQALEPAGTQSNAHFGELVCQNPFPSRPLAFYGDHDRSQFHKAYFQQNPGMWTHGDLIEFTESGGARLHGRSDSILNANGIRIGPAEIYQVLQGFPEIQEAMAVEQKAPEQPGEGRLVLLIVPREPGSVDNILRAKVRKRLALEASPAHVPARIVEVAELPVTYSGKRSERAVRDALNGTAGSNTEAIRNPGCLEDICRQVDLEDQSLLLPDYLARVGVEDRLRAIWERVLGFRDVDADDSFFNLGGSSIMALRLCREINDQLGVTIGPWVLFHAPTLRALTLALDTKGSALSPIVPLRPDGSGYPVLLVAGMYGDLMELRSLFGKIRCVRPLYGVRARGLAPGESPHASVEEMADDYLEHLRRLQPSGPYSLIGYSFGGLVAFEMACRLREANDEVEFLGLIDTDVHEGCLGVGERLRFWAMRPLRYGRVIAGAPLTTVPELFNRYLRARFGKMTTRGGINFAMPPLLLHLAKMHQRAFARYRPRPYDGSVTIFRAVNRWPRYCDPLPVWRSLVSGRVFVRNIPGLHHEVVQEPAVSALAGDLEALISGERELTVGSDLAMKQNSEIILVHVQGPSDEAIPAAEEAEAVPR